MELLDVSAPLFSVTEVSEVSGISRANIDLLVSQKLIRPTRRVKVARPVSTKSRGKPMFSARAAFIVRLIRDLHSLGLSYADSAAIADLTEKATLSKSEIVKNSNESLIRLLELADGDWIAAFAKNPSRFQTDRVFGYASRLRAKWSVGLCMVATRASDQSVGAAPKIFVPASDIFFDVYAACSALVETL